MGVGLDGVYISFFEYFEGVFFNVCAIYRKS